MISKTIHCLVILLLAYLHILNANTNPSNSDLIPQLGNGIAAIVEGEIITFEEVRSSLDPLIPKIRLQSENEAEFKNLINQISRDLLQNKIDRIIIVKSAEKAGLRIPTSYIDQEYETLIKEQFQGNRSQFLAYLNNLGKTQEDFREELRKDLIVRYMRGQKQTNQAQISPEKIENFYIENKHKFYQSDAIHLKQIILPANESQSSTETLDLAYRIVTELDNGVPFEKLAKTYAKGQFNRPNGDWGWVNREDLRSELSDVAFLLEPKDHSQPIVVGESVFIVYAESIQEAGIQPISKVRDIIENILRKEIAEKSIENWLSQLRSEAFIRYFL